MQTGPTEIFRDGSRRSVVRQWVPEAPVALEFNGLSYAVMMATPTDLDDFARGFALTEGLAKRPKNIRSIDVAEVDAGVIVRTTIDELDEEQLAERVRARVAESSCGLCGVENLEALAKPLPSVPPHTPPEAEAVFKAVTELDKKQELNRRTGAAHGAAFCGPNGSVLLLREDVGRHNAVDKLVGALAESEHDAANGFFISTARCSYEIVEKVVRAGGTVLITVSLPTSLAIERARQAGLTLNCLARSDSFIAL